MRWELVPSGIPDLKEYRLIDEQRTAMMLRYHPEQNSVRLSCNLNQRIFFLEHHGFIRSHTSFFDEYGLPAGRLHLSHWEADSFHLVIQGHPFQISYRLEATGSFLIYSSDRKIAVLAVEVVPEDLSRLTAREAAGNDELVCLLLATCWYQSQVYHPQLKKEGSLIFHS